LHTFAPPLYGKWMHSDHICAVVAPSSLILFRLLAVQDGRSPYFGVVVGRCANRIQGASFILDGKTHKLAANDGNNSLHGGQKGFDKHIWAAREIEHAEGQAVELSRVSRDGEEVTRYSYTEHPHIHDVTACAVGSSQTTALT
jgi:galactose mutarotase-like enzyme